MSKQKGRKNMMKKLSIPLICILFLWGCSNEDSENSNSHPNSNIIQSQENINYETDSVKDKVDDYFQKENEKVASYKAIHTNNQLFVAFNATTLQQPKEQDLEKKIKKDLRKTTDIDDVYVTSDQKFYMELTKLEDQSMTEEEMNKKVEKFKKLMKEQS